jgi:hypothetical protein
MRIGSALWWLWYTRVGTSEGRISIECAVGMAADDHSSARAKALTAAGLLACYQTDYAAAERYVLAAIELSNAQDDRFGQAWPPFVLGMTYLFQGRAELAESRLAEGYAAFAEIGSHPWTAYALFCLGVLHGPLIGDLARAAELFNQALMIFRDIGFVTGIAIVLGNLGALVLAGGDIRRAEVAFREALVLRLQLRDRWGLAQHLRELAQLAAIELDAERGVRLYAASIALLDSLQTEPPALFMAAWHRTETWLRAQADDPANSTAWNEGYSRPIEQAIAEVEAPSPGRSPELDSLAG